GKKVKNKNIRYEYDVVLKAAWDVFIGLGNAFNGWFRLHQQRLLGERYDYSVWSPVSKHLWGDAGLRIHSVNKAFKRAVAFWTSRMNQNLASQGEGSLQF
ncbi:hypothetical protein KAU11_04070, partial [Candidatus Babeliales bacterium]|nr:hypothetical protein [Candidatus Babeliales bacterium]